MTDELYIVYSIDGGGEVVELMEFNGEEYIFSISSVQLVVKLTTIFMQWIQMLTSIF